MTCIVGIKRGDTVYIGGDGLLTSGDSILHTNYEKVFTNGDFLMGVCGYAKSIMVLKHQFKPPRRGKDETIEHYIFNKVYSRLVQLFEETNISQISENVHDNGGEIIFAYKGRLFLVGCDFSITEKTDYIASGSGKDYAMGCLCASMVMDNLTPEEQITGAIEAAANLCTSVNNNITIKTQQVK